MKKTDKTPRAVRLLLTLLILFMGLPAICQTSQKVTREIKIAKGQRYLNFPVAYADPQVRGIIRVKKGSTLDRFTINLAEGTPDYWFYFDVTPYQGKTLIVEVEKVPPRGSSVQAVQSDQMLNPRILDNVFVDINYPGQENLYNEEGRFQVHFSADRGWINDPNGLIYYNGEYHMYFQHNPYGWQHGNMHWGHAVSKDLIHWEQLPEAIYPYIDDAGAVQSDAAFSGSAVTDPLNTAGFRRNGIDPLIAFYTSTGRGECIKLSYDNGRTFEDFEGNPVLVHRGRDPKVFWYAPGNHWVMVVWSSGMAHKIGQNIDISLREHSIYTSNDLKKWTYQSGIPGFFECPELFELPVEGMKNVTKWVMYDAHGRYVVGDFDGKVFNIEQHFTKYENGGGYFYASQTFNGTPDGRRIQIGWGRNITNPGMPFNQPELFPTELKLKKSILGGYRLCPTPIEEINMLTKRSVVKENIVVTTTTPLTINTNSNSPLHIITEIERGDGPITLDILGYKLNFDNEWTFSTNAPDEANTQTVVPAGPFPAPTASTPVIYVPEGNILKIEAIVDKNLLEFFINDGELYYVTAFNGTKTSEIVASITSSSSVRSAERTFLVKKLDVRELNSIWAK